MKKALALLIIVALSVGVYSCDSQVEEYYQQCMNTKDTVSIGQLKTMFGEPTAEFSNSVGNKIYLFNPHPFYVQLTSESIKVEFESKKNRAINMRCGELNFAFGTTVDIT